LLTDDQIEATISEAFRPFPCTIEILPERLVRFKVRKQWTRMSIYTEPGIPIEPLREESDLRELLRSVRLVLVRRATGLALSNSTRMCG